MNMFHELMMRKKEEIMYATIKGSLTESPSGVFSGFSSSNYLALQQIPNFNNNFELVVKITTGDLSTEQRILAYNTGGINSVYIQNTYLKWFIYGNSSSNILSTEALSPNTTYWIKIKRSGNEFSLSYSTDGITYRGLRTKTVTDTIQLSNYFDFGVNHTSYYSPFAGSIDLNNSYIKLGSTKYNLQAVVGYTVVGNPTITDGVVSGFSASDYLKTNGSLTSLENVETVVKFKFSSLTSSTRRPLGYASYDTASGVYISANGTLNLTAGRYADNTVVSVPTNFVCSVNTWYWLKIQYKTNNIVVSISTDGVTYTQIGLGENINVSNIYLTLNRNFGIGTSLSQNGTYSEFVNGSIDLKETYIKKNNKLWFNGQQA